MSTLNHVHTWRKLKVRKRKFQEQVMRNGEPMFICDHANCGSMKPLSQLKGKASACNLCGNTFVLTMPKLACTKPRCDDCSNTKDSKKKDEARELINSYLDELTMPPVLEERSQEDA